VNGYAINKLINQPAAKGSSRVINVGAHLRTRKTGFDEK
jgi:hypothetical protein